MLTGRFGNTSARPYLEGSLIIPRLNVGAVLSFLVDTGADDTFVMPADGLTLGLDYGQLRGRDDTGRGAGGPFTAYHEPALVTFTDGANLFGSFVTVGILQQRDDMLKVPSLLGRDIIHRWHMRYQHSGRTLHFDVESADVVVPAAGPFPLPSTRHE